MENSDDLINAFIEEAREHIPVIEANLLALEHKPDDTATINELFRGVHTIKGGAGFLSLNNISTLAHSMESLLSLARTNKLRLTTEHTSLLLECNDLMALMIDDPQHADSISINKQCLQLDDFVNNPDALPKFTIEAPALITPSEFANDSPLEADDLIASFIEEARECVPLIERCLLALEVTPCQTQQLNELFRHVHTIKGGACFLGLTKIAELSHVMEDILGLARNAELMLDESIIEQLLEAYDYLVQLIEHHNNDNALNIELLCQRLQLIKELAVKDSSPSIISQPLVALPTPPPVIPLAEPALTPLAKPIIEETDSTVFTTIETEESIRVHVKRLNKLIDLAGELVLVRNQFFRLCEPLMTATPGLKVMLNNFNRITSEMQEEIMSTRMQPVGIIFNKFPRLIRQLEKDLGKHLELVTEGADVELDKTIIESLTDPVTHIIRNMADHGIELPEERLKRGKPASGTLLQKAFHESGQVVIQFSDDGAGINSEFVALKAVQKGIITQEVADKMSQKEKMNLIFTAGFSTAEKVSSVSGRGIGLDVVKTNVEACGGSIDINSELGKWTSITMTLPLTMAIISALIVRVENRCFAFPQGNLEEMVLLETEDYANRVGITNGQRMLSLRGTFIPLISLATSLKIITETDLLVDNGDKPFYILIIKADHNRVAVLVDSILGSEEIVVKPMPEYFKQIKNFSGTSILGDGRIAMIIDVQAFIHSSELAYPQLQKNNRTFTQRNVEQESQSLLIFDNNTEEHFALALSWIQRIDTLDTNRIQTIAGDEYIEYRGEQVRLLRMENCLSVQKPNSYKTDANIIIPKHTQVPVALLINRVIDTKNTVIKLENAAIKTPGILGSMLLDGKITLLLDLHSILQTGEPECVEKLVINIETAKLKHILLVEDTPFFMKVIKECVQSAGYKVSTAVNGREGLEILNKGSFDLVLSDIEMPLMDGREMVKNIRANPAWNHLPVIALTTLNDEHTISEGKKAGFNDWLVKLDKELVLKTLARYL